MNDTIMAERGSEIWPALTRHGQEIYMITSEIND